MYSWELEVQAKRKALAVLHDEINRILNSARDLSARIDSLIKGDVTDVRICLSKMKNSQEVVENLRIILTRKWLKSVVSPFTGREF